MKIAIIVHSKTGNTLKFAEKIKEKLTAAGHEVDLTHLQTATPVDGKSIRQKNGISFTSLPDVSSADAVLFGGPVWGFNPSPVILQAMLALAHQMKGKLMLPFLTMGFPFAWMGGKGSLNRMRRTAGTMGARVLNGAIVTGQRKGFDERLELQADLVYSHLRS